MRVTAAAEAVGTCPSAVNALQLRPRQEQQGGYDYKQSWRNQWQASQRETQHRPTTPRPEPS